MPDSNTIYLAAETSGKGGGSALQGVDGAMEAGVAQIEAMPSDVANIPLVQDLTAVMPAADLIFGGAMLVVIVLMHATGVRFITNHVVARWQAIMQRPTAWRADLLMSSSVFVLLALHLVEMLAWAAALVYSGLVPDWRSAGFFAGNTYTTVGYGAFVLPNGWRMLAPIIAISGLFTFGWSGSVLVDLVGRCQKIKDAANKK
ncbi:MAG: ion channel [Casimicrobiaceae bacterium]